ncbi:hypothetical protein BDV93DRAFT_278336 [Ceratobasidium sp. AG-I]|nr:hypothetical protein BDV93DRAFT_278336 [Ceratobasidium sp. AG-I]
MPKKTQNRIAEQEIPEIKDGICVCRVGVARGGSQFEVWDGETNQVAELPKRFRNTIWVRRGSYVLVNSGNNSSTSGGVRGEIVFVLQKEHISQLRKQGHWPSKIEETQETPETPDTQDADGRRSPDEGVVELTGGDAEKGGDFSDSDLFQNNNRR